MYGMPAAAATRATRPVARTLLLGGILVGVLDGLDAVIVFGWLGASPVRIFQGIAVGLLGREAYQGGLATALLGLAIHFTIALSIVAYFCAAARTWPRLVRRPIVTGAAYGVAVYLFMNLVVIPVSRIGPVLPQWPMVVNGLLIHVFGIGIPAALTAVRASAPRR